MPQRPVRGVYSLSMRHHTLASAHFWLACGRLRGSSCGQLRDASGSRCWGAWNAITRKLITVTNTTVVNTETLCELLHKIAALNLTGPITLVLDNARYQRNATVQALADQQGITLLFLPSHSPNLNLIERLWRFIKRRAIYGRYHPTFADFKAAIEETINGLSTTHADPLETLVTLNFQQFEDVSLLTA